MKKYPCYLMLSADVLDEIDQIAERENTTRSNLVNRILADYVSLTMPEKHFDRIFRTVENFLNGCGGFSPFFEPNSPVMSIKSSLEYRYRPTLRYEVEMYRTPDAVIGELNVIFRTQAPELLVELTRFFKLWMNLEALYVSAFFSENAIRYSLAEGRFTRTFALPRERSYDPEETGRAIGDYVETFDELLKKWLSGEFSSQRELENAYLARLNGGMLMI